MLLKRAEKYDAVVGSGNDLYLASTEKSGDIRKLNLAVSQKIHNHSPAGFSWGYNGSGPSQTALAILLELFGKKIALEYYQDFKSELISVAPKGYFVFRIKYIEEWLMEKRAAPVFDKLKKEVENEL